jgi:hypothetical protein
MGRRRKRAAPAAETERKLRSVTRQDQGSEVIDGTLYEFEINSLSNLVDFDELLLLADRTQVTLPNVSGFRDIEPIAFEEDKQGDASNVEAKALSSPNDKRVRLRRLSRDAARGWSTASSDPLDESKYMPYHRRMEREEKRIQSIERERSLEEMDRMLAQRNILRGSSWRRDIRYITKISEDDSEASIQRKRQLTLQEIDDYLRKYRSWKKREAELKATKQIVASPTPFTVGSGSESRSSSREPEPSQLHIVKKPFTSFYSDPRKRPRFDVLVKRPSRVNFAFGHEIPSVGHRDFDLPDSWKR